jgi:hypothetical protein
MQVGVPRERKPGESGVALSRPVSEALGLAA